MSLFDILIVQPIFNLLVFIYAVIPGHDFGIALIIFTVIIRLLMWPLVKKQLHQTKIMRNMQPDLQRIKKKTKGNKQLEAQLMMELYREKGVNPFGSIGLLILQLPIFIALFAVVNLITTDKANIAKFSYDFIEKLPHLAAVVANPDQFNKNLFGFIDLSQHAFSNGHIQWAIVILAVLASVFQFIQSKQLIPKTEEGRKLRDILKEQAAGKDVDQSEVTALMSNRMMLLFPFLTFIFSVSVAGALTLYLVVSTGVAILQQSYILGQDFEEMDKLGNDKKQKKTALQERAKKAKDAEIIEAPAKAKKKKKGKA